MWRLKRLLELPPRAALQKVLAVLHASLRLAVWRIRDLVRSSYPQTKNVAQLGTVIAQRVLRLEDLGGGEWLTQVADHYLAHRFDLLGSGWVIVRHGMRCRGLEGARYQSAEAVHGPDSDASWLRRRINRANRREAQRIRRLIDPGYVPIDWQLDFKSGYRWREKSWYQWIPYGHLPGVDVKVPWELSRMQHLPQLALAFHAAQRSGRMTRPPEHYAREFRNQVLDFIAANPPRFGVNWRCTMDVAIRAVNWLIAYDLFRACGAEFDPDFERVLAASVHAHGRHIVGNLEWFPDGRGNHYLADIVGLLFVAVYLPRSAEADAWLAFAVQELLGEVELQFTPDGANFEASTSYHRLSTEMVLYATALLSGLSDDKRTALTGYDPHRVGAHPRLQPPSVSAVAQLNDSAIPLPAWYLERVERMVEFTMHAMKPDHKVAQFGDNDNGRLLRIWPAYFKTSVREARDRYANLRDYDLLGDEDTYWEEAGLDHGHLVGVARALFERADFAAAAPEDRVEESIVRALSGDRAFGSYRVHGVPGADTVRIGTDGDWRSAVESVLHATDGEMKCTLEVVVAGEGLWDQLQLHAYPDFGLYLYRSRRVFLAIRCGAVGQNGRGGHAHNDQLSFELNVDGEDWVTDPGTYLYTPMPTRRNEYRSARAHWGPRVADVGEPGGAFRYGLFRLGNAAAGKCSYFGPQGFAGKYDGYGQAVHRVFRLQDRGIEIVDWTDGPGRLEPFLPSRITGPLATAVPLSVGYGMRATC